MNVESRFHLPDDVLPRGLGDRALPSARCAAAKARLSLAVIWPDRGQYRPLDPRRRLVVRLDLPPMLLGADEPQPLSTSALEGKGRAIPLAWRAVLNLSRRTTHALDAGLAEVEGEL